MPTNRFQFSDDFVLNANKVGINSAIPQEKLDVVGIVKGDNLKVTGVSSFTSYEGFLNSNHNITENTTLTSGTSVPWKSLKIGYETQKEHLCFIDYEEIVNSPEETLKKVYEFCELEYYSGHYFENLSNPSPENDDAYGIQGLHDVRKKLGRISPKPEEILGEELVKYYDNLKLEFWQ